MQSIIPPRHHFGISHVAYWDDFLTPEDINLILSLPQWTSVTEGKVGSVSEGKVIQEKRITTVGWMERSDETKLVWEKIVSAIANVNSQYFHYDLTGCFEPAQLGIYKSSDLSHYDWHADDSLLHGTTPRKLSMSLLLDNPSSFDGGELHVMNQSDTPTVLEQKKGRAWFFPSWMLHRVTPVTRGVRRSMVLWVAGPSFK